MRQKRLKFFMSIGILLVVGFFIFQVNLSSKSYAGNETVTTGKVTVETGDILPIEGSVWIQYEIQTKNQPFDGTLVIRETLDTGNVANENESGIETIYPIHLEAGQNTGRVKYTVLSNPYQMSFRKSYQLKTNTGAVIKAGSLAYSGPITKSSVMILSESLKNWKQSSANRVVLQKSTMETDSDLLTSYKTYAMTHEDALTLTKEMQDMLLSEVSQGARLLIVNPVGHEKLNFVEDITGRKFDQTGMTNIKHDLSYMLGENRTKDIWIETGKTAKGESFGISAYGKGSLLQLGYDPFEVEALNSVEKQALGELLWVNQNDEIKYSNDGNAFSGMMRKLPFEFVPSFIVMLVLVGGFLVLGVITGLYFGKVKKYAQGFVLSIIGSTVLCLLALMGYRVATGYSGVLINEISTVYVSKEGYQTQVDFVGFKSNKDKLRLVGDSIELEPTQVNWYKGTDYKIIHQMGDKESWVVPRMNKWEINEFKMSRTQKAEAVKGKLNWNQGGVVGEVQNTSEETWLNPVLLVNGMAYPLDTVKAKETLKLNVELMGGQNIRRIAGDRDHLAKALFYEKNIEGQHESSALINGQTVYALLEGSLNQFPEIKSGIKLVVFTTGFESRYKLESEKEQVFRRGVQIFDLANLDTGVMNKTVREVRADQFFFINGNTMKQEIWSADIAVGSKSVGIPLIGISKPRVDTMSSY
jgi:hypothetical protein